ncbi:MAG: sulfurtransferase TusA family protein [Candidatus Limnocylindrales bacterium]
MEFVEDRLVDARGFQCPMPIVLANKEMQALAVGGILRILATDRGAAQDMPAWAEDIGHVILDSGELDGALYFVIRKGEEED